MTYSYYPPHKSEFEFDNCVVKMMFLQMKHGGSGKQGDFNKSSKLLLHSLGNVMWPLELKIGDSGLFKAL